MSQAQETLWVRCGDQDDYHDYDGGDLYALADYLDACGVTGPLERHSRLGVTSPEYRGNNYISLYVSNHRCDHDGDNRDITDAELNEINHILEKSKGA